MADALRQSGVFSSCGRQFAVRGSPRRAAGKVFSVAGFCSVRSSPAVVRNLRYSLGSDFRGRKVVGWEERRKPAKVLKAVNAQMNLRLKNVMRWWEKGLHPNMKEVQSAQDLVDSLSNAGDRLVIVDFFSPGCGGCKALHPKICQFAEMNPEVLFLQMNYEEHKSMCYSLNVHVLPFFRFYRGAQGRVCSFSCTNATIKKFRDALAKHNTDRCSLGPVKGLEESELFALAANKDLAFTYTKKPEPAAEPAAAPEPIHLPVPAELPLSPAPKAAQGSEGKAAVVGAGR